MVTKKGGVNMDYTLLRGAVRRKYGTLKEFSKTLGITQTALGLKLNGKQSFSMKQIIRIVELLDLTTDDIGDYFFTKEVRKR